MPRSLLAAGVFCALVVTVTSLSVSHNHHRRQTDIPCNHPLRIVVPSLFSHCPTSCDYSDWTPWETVQRDIPTTTSKCASRKYYTQRRTRQLLSVVGDRADCNEVNETQNICYPTNEERLIFGLGLGGSGQQIDTNTQTIKTVIPNEDKNNNMSSPSLVTRKKRSARARFVRTVNSSATRCPHLNTTGEVCQHLSADRLCKRSSGEYHDTSNKRAVNRRTTGDGVSVLSGNSAPIAFDWSVHGSHFRQRRQTRCSDDDTQHVLFILDSSGSISQSDFADMKAVMSKLVPLFCKKIKTALINFSSDIRLEYCFDCFLNTIFGRNAASVAINETEYLGQCTNSAATAKCVCENILHTSCGISSTPDCLDVVFITDGHSNDPNLRICDEIECLHNQAGINTYALGIGGYDRDELECIENTSDSFGTFEFETFQEFKESINNVVALVTDATLSENYHSCATRNVEFSPTGGPFV